MRFGLVFSTLASLLTVVAIGIPIPFGPRGVPGGTGPLAGSAPRCLSLRYEQQPEAAWLPSMVRLRSGAARIGGPGWFAADGGPTPGLHTIAWWRAAGPDSMDIAWHHSPLLRLPVRGDSVMVGRVEPAGVAPLVQVLALHVGTVIAREMPCGEFVAPAA